MKLPEQQIRIVAGTPIEAGSQRLMPSVLVQEGHWRWGNSGLYRYTRLRAVSVVAASGDAAEWHEIPDVTAQMLSSMLVSAAAIGVVGIVILVLSHLLHRR